MASVVCSPGSSLINDLCLSHCPPNFITLPSDVTMCVSDIACPEDTTQVDLMTCQKSFEAAVDGSCVRGAQYSPDVCYYPTPCPAPFLENGFNCLKRIMDRTSATPHCSNPLFLFENGQCYTLAMYGWLTLFFGLLVAVAIGRMLFPYHYE